MIDSKEVDLLSAQNKGLKIQNKNLQITIINYEKKIKEAIEICNEFSTNADVIIFQTRIKSILK